MRLPVDPALGTTRRTYAGSGGLVRPQVVVANDCPPP